MTLYNSSAVGFVCKVGVVTATAGKKENTLPFEERLPDRVVVVENTSTEVEYSGSGLTRS